MPRRKASGPNRARQAGGLLADRETPSYQVFADDLLRVMRVVARRQTRPTPLSPGDQGLVDQPGDHRGDDRRSLCRSCHFEQYRSEFKTDLDVARRPSGKFATTALVLACAWLAYTTVLERSKCPDDPEAPPRHPAKCRLLHTVIQEPMSVATRLICTASA